MRKFLRFRLKTFLLFVLLIAVACGYVSQQEIVYEREQASIKRMQESVVGVKIEPAKNLGAPQISFY